jgi:hypothetical protein
MAFSRACLGAVSTLTPIALQIRRPAALFVDRIISYSLCGRYRHDRAIRTHGRRTAFHSKREFKLWRHRRIARGDGGLRTI